jgi:hypothetical protein
VGIISQRQALRHIAAAPLDSESGALGFDACLTRKSATVRRAHRIGGQLPEVHESVDHDRFHEQQDTAVVLGYE